MKYRLMGAKTFLKKAHPGTLFIPWPRRDNMSLQDQIDLFRKDPADLVRTFAGELHIFGDNSYSADFYYEDDIDIEAGDTYLYDYDYNIVGDATPFDTLYIVFPSAAVPDLVLIETGHRPTTNDAFLFKGDCVANIGTRDKPLYAHYLGLEKQYILAERDKWVKEEFPKEYASFHRKENRQAITLLDDEVRTEEQYAIINVDIEVNC